MLINRAINTIMQSELIGKVLQHEAFIESILKAVTTSLEAKDAFSARYETILRSVGLVTSTQLDVLKEMLDALNQEADALREQLDHAAQSTRSLRQRASKAEAELAQAIADLESAQAELTSLKAKTKVTSKSKAKPKTQAKPTPKPAAATWSPTMTKAELIEIAKSLGMKVSTKVKKTDLINRLGALAGDH